MSFAWGQIWKGNVDFQYFRRLELVPEPYIREQYIDSDEIANLSIKFNSVFQPVDSIKQENKPNNITAPPKTEQVASLPERNTSPVEKTIMKPNTPQIATKNTSNASNLQKSMPNARYTPKYENYGGRANEELRGKYDPHIPPELRELYDICEVTPKLFPPDYTFDSDYDTQRLLKVMFKKSGFD